MNQTQSQDIISQEVLNTVVLDWMKEQKRQWRFRWAKRFLISLIVIFGITKFVIMDKSITAVKSHVGVIDIYGPIFDEQGADNQTLSKSLERAYKNTNMKAIILKINSPGGSPVQADDMYNTIQYYRKKHPTIKIYSVCVDLCASAAYYIASGTDEIYANPSSMVGSIGVIYNGFGFVDLMEKVGVSRRMQTAGRNKGFLDPFSPASPEQTAYLQRLLDGVHQQFIDKVKAGRGNRLKIDADTFSGLIWTGTLAKERGLIDGFASTQQLARDTIHIDSLVDYTQGQGFIDRVSKNMGAAMVSQLPQAMGIGFR